MSLPRRRACARLRLLHSMIFVIQKQQLAIKLADLHNVFEKSTTKILFA
jgi:hypothetical protein